MSSEKSTMEYFWDEVDRLSNRVMIAACGGLLIGSSAAVLKGLPFRQSAFSSTVSTSIAATTCFTSERCVNMLLPRSDSVSALNEDRRHYISHGLGGLAGGALIGMIYKSSPLSGGLLFTPIMFAVAFAENQVDEYREERIRNLLDEIDNNNSSGSK
mmetsp:Transcript_28919/g.29287  ORF Transcript_28919/g.29287 Transcript_28919/m.29287 type:complete len:157 (-) Transcript_28919:132-602(-)